MSELPPGDPWAPGKIVRAEPAAERVEGKYTGRKEWRQIEGK